MILYNNLWTPVYSQACSVSSAALVSSLHLTKDSFDVVKRWTNEVQESCSSDNIMVQVCSLTD